MITRVLLSKVLGSFDEDFEMDEVTCPVCGNNYQHVLGAEMVDGEDDYQAWRGRGDLVLVSFSGECGSEWGIGFGFHKGNTYTDIAVIKSCQVEDNHPELTPIEVSFLKEAQNIIEGIEPQYWIGQYRVDFAIPDKKVVIELDGHDYHKTKEQRTSDAQRERYLELEGWRVIRFTGSEIHKDASKCVFEALDLITKWTSNGQ